MSKINQLPVNTYGKYKIDYEINIEVWCEKSMQGLDISNGENMRGYRSL